jgi:NitT/TauT family transport system substrate-binding protein
MAPQGRHCRIDLLLRPAHHGDIGAVRRKCIGNRQIDAAGSARPNTAWASKRKADMRSPITFIAGGRIRWFYQDRGASEPTEFTVMSCWRVVAIVALAVLAAMPVRAQERPEVTKVRLAVGGKPALFYLPLTVVERLGLFRQQGLEVEISDFAGGARALQAMVGGSADVVTGAFDHTIQMQAKNRSVVGVVQLGRFPGYVVGVLAAKAQGYRDAKDLKGMKIGITAPGSSSHFMVQYLMMRNGLKPDDASFISVGATASAVAAVRRGEIDAIVNVDPVIALLESQKLIKVVADTRTEDGTRAIYGGIYPAAALYAPSAFIEKNPRTMQALANAFVRGLKWIAGHSADEIAAVMPEDYALGDKALYIQSIKNSLPMYSPDGRFSREGAEVAYKVLKEFDPEVGGARIDITATYTDTFVAKAPTSP